MSDLNLTYHTIPRRYDDNGTEICVYYGPYQQLETDTENRFWLQIDVEDKWTDDRPTVTTLVEWWPTIDEVRQHIAHLQMLVESYEQWELDKSVKA